MISAVVFQKLLDTYNKNQEGFDPTQHFRGESLSQYLARQISEIQITRDAIKTLDQEVEAEASRHKLEVLSFVHRRKAIENNCPHFESDYHQGGYELPSYHSCKTCGKQIDDLPF